MSNIAEITEVIFAQFDTDKSGTLDRNELRTILEGAGQPVTEEVLTDALKAIDTDNDGTVSKAEFAELLKVLMG